MKRKKKEEFSKWLLVQESILIWIQSICFFLLAFLAIKYNYSGALPWLTACATLPWTAYGTSCAFYYNKAKKENTEGGIVYETAMKKIEQQNNTAIGDNDNIYYGI